MDAFRLVSDFSPEGDQPQAVEELTQGVVRGDRFQTLLGVTGSGKTFTMAHVVANVQRPTLVISHNKTLAAQLYSEFKAFFPDNAVEYFVSYYDYYQPEAYMPATDTYIEKDADINAEIDRLRLRATSALLERRDVLIVASVSCIYGIGSPEEYEGMHVVIEKGQETERDEMLGRLIDIHYNRNDFEFARGTFRVRGDVVEILPAYETEAIRVEFFGDVVDAISVIDTTTGHTVDIRDRVSIYPARHFVTTSPKVEVACQSILAELESRVRELRDQDKLLEAQRLDSRTRYDVEMLKETGYCSGVENYSRHISGRQPGERPWCLLDYFPEDILMFIDESHVSIPQLRGMWAGDRSRKEMLVEYGFRLPSAYDNRPLYFAEFESMIRQAVFVSATPGDYEIEKSAGRVVEQIIRPTGLVDPSIVVRPVSSQVDDLMEEIKVRVGRKERVLVTTLTKKMAENLADYLSKMGVRTHYLHSEIQALDRVGILRRLRLGDFDVLVGINLLREGLDLPEVSLVAILDADKEGFLRSERSLIQTSGRAARHAAGEVIFYADSVTDSMRRALDEMNRRRSIQLAYNELHGITPQSIHKSTEDILKATSIADVVRGRAQAEMVAEEAATYEGEMDREQQIEMLESIMRERASRLEFEEAAILRDEIARLKGGS